jgi:hypothetical protein
MSSISNNCQDSSKSTTYNKFEIAEKPSNMFIPHIDVFFTLSTPKLEVKSEVKNTDAKINTQNLLEKSFNDLLSIDLCTTISQNMIKTYESVIIDQNKLMEQDKVNKEIALEALKTEVEKFNAKYPKDSIDISLKPSVMFKQYMFIKSKNEFNSKQFSKDSVSKDSNDSKDSKDSDDSKESKDSKDSDDSNSVESSKGKCSLC